jgi:UDP-N-acetylglucosamine/UDP-N-acetylgalactosamine 4-epimerase
VRKQVRSQPKFDLAIAEISSRSRTWLITGAAGFIGSHLVEELLKLGQKVVGIDNFSNGSEENLKDVASNVGIAFRNFTFVQGDICEIKTCQEVCAEADIVLHQAALGSVPRSITNPIETNRSNVTGFLNILCSAKDAGIKRFVFASSSSVYGDNAELPKVEERIGRPLSPYAVSKVTNELYAKTFSEVYGIDCIGLRYFNVFGSRQRANSPYAAVIPKWIMAMLDGEGVQIFGDGTTSRDFCYVKNAVQMNLLAATTMNPNAMNRVFNTACNRRTTLNDVYSELKTVMGERKPGLNILEKLHMPPRMGDILHSQARITDAEIQLGYQPLYHFKDGLIETVDWYLKNLDARVPGKVNRENARNAPGN